MQDIKYGYSIQLQMSFSEAVVKVKEGFLSQGFGALSEINVQEKMWEKLQKRMDGYLILGMCNPKLAAAAIDMEPNIGLLLPCNVIVRQTESGVVVAAQKPSLMSEIVPTPGMEAIAKEAEEKILIAMQVIEGNTL